MTAPELGDHIRGGDMDPPRNANSTYYWVRCPVQSSPRCLGDRWTVITKTKLGTPVKNATTHRTCAMCDRDRHRVSFHLSPRKTPTRPM